jgi:hypothetical protein
MKKSLTRTVSILAILVLVLGVLGCQGYQPPEYKGPADAEDEDDAIEIDVSDIGEDDDDEPSYREVKYPEPELEPAATVRETAKPKYEEVEYTDDEEEADADYKKAAYRPVIEEEGLPALEVNEGDLVKINVKATDADGDILTYTFTSPLNSEGEWQTRMGDSGVYYSTITVSDGKTDVEKQVKIIVQPENNKPVLVFIPKTSDITRKGSM